MLQGSKKLYYSKSRKRRTKPAGGTWILFTERKDSSEDYRQNIKITVKRIFRKTGYNRESKNVIIDTQPGTGCQEQKEVRKDERDQKENDRENREEESIGPDGSAFYDGYAYRDCLRNVKR